MKLTKRVITQFETEQETYGTNTALSNLLWAVAADIMTSVGVTGIKTTYRTTRRSC